MTNLNKKCEYCNKNLIINDEEYDFKIGIIAHEKCLDDGIKESQETFLILYSNI